MNLDDFLGFVSLEFLGRRWGLEVRSSLVKIEGYL